MNFWQRGQSLVFGRLTPEERKVFQLQMLLLFAISTLLYIGFPGTREWRRIAEEMQMQTIMRGWDGLAWYTWLAAAPVMLLLIRRYPFGPGRYWQNAGRLLLGSFVLYLIVAHLRYALRVLPDILHSPRQGYPLDLHTYAYNTFGMLPLDFLTCCGFFAVSFSVDYYFKLRQRSEEAIQLQLKTAQLQADLARAELAALRGQLHPHFLFNSFNALATLVRQRKNEAAVEIIAQLSALLRLAIDQTGLQETPLEQELDFIRRYLEVEHLRFGDKLRVDFAIEPATLAAMVPNVILQPLVENAIKHGISLRITPGLVRVVATRAEDRLHIEIVDDGSEEAQTDVSRTLAKKPGIGLANTRARLARIYGRDYHLELNRRPQGGTVVSLDLPWRLSPTPGLAS